MLCGHCGTEANAGFTRCVGCGAHYRGSARSVFFGILLAVSFFLIAPIMLKQRSFESVIAMLLVAFIIGAIIIRGFQRRWYR